MVSARSIRCCRTECPLLLRVAVATRRSSRAPLRCRGGGERGGAAAVLAGDYAAEVRLGDGPHLSGEESARRAGGGNARGATGLSCWAGIPISRASRVLRDANPPAAAGGPSGASVSGAAERTTQ